LSSAHLLLDLLLALVNHPLPIADFVDATDRERSKFMAELGLGISSCSFKNDGIAPAFFSKYAPIKSLLWR